MTDLGGILAFDGGSNTRGFGTTTGMGYPEQTDRLVSSLHEWYCVAHLHSHAPNPTSLTMMIADAGDVLDPFVGDDPAYSVLVADSIGTISNAATRHADMTTYVAARQSEGWTVYVLTARPGITNRDAYNALLLGERSRSR